MRCGVRRFFRFVASGFCAELVGALCFGLRFGLLYWVW